MKVLGIDMATKTGFGLVVDGQLKSYGLLSRPEISQGSEELEDFYLLRIANAVAKMVWDLYEKEKPDFMFIEQTNQGSFRSTQKQLEFLHAVLLQLFLNNDLTEKVFYVDTSKWRSSLEVKLSKEQRKHNKAVKTGSAKGKVTPKHLAVAWANATYSLELLKKDHDIADSIAIATYGYNLKTKSPTEIISSEQLISELNIPKI